MRFSLPDIKKRREELARTSKSKPRRRKKITAEQVEAAAILYLVDEATITHITQELYGENSKNFSTVSYTLLLAVKRLFTKGKLTLKR